MNTKTKSKKVKKSEHYEFMSYSDFDKATLYVAAKRAHAVLSAAIKKALGLKQWPNFDHYPHDALMCQCAAKLLIDEMAKLRTQRDLFQELLGKAVHPLNEVEYHTEHGGGCRHVLDEGLVNRCRKALEEDQ